MKGDKEVKPKINRAFFVAAGATGGHTAASHMTKAERVQRARKAAAARHRVQKATVRR